MSCYCPQFFSSFIHVYEIFQTFFCLQRNSIPLCISTTFSLYIHQFKDILVVSIPSLLCIEQQWTLLSKYLRSKIWCPLGIYHVDVQLGHMINLFSAFWGFSRLMRNIASQGYTLTSNEWEFLILHIFPSMSVGGLVDLSHSQQRDLKSQSLFELLRMMNHIWEIS